MRLGVIKFDSALAKDSAERGSLQNDVYHEIAHVLGFGIRWKFFGIIERLCPATGKCNNNPVYTGLEGKLGYKILGGSGPIPLENVGGRGSRNYHWRESIFGNEIMTSKWNSDSNPVSVMTLQALRDLGIGTKLSTNRNFRFRNQTQEAARQKFKWLMKSLIVSPLISIPTFLNKRRWMRWQTVMETKEG